MQSPIKLIKTYASFVKFAHTVFALPFAIAGMVAAYATPVGLIVETWNGVPPARDYVQFTWDTVGLIVLCMVGARSFAMAVNRIIDRRIDALNPRTAKRELPAGSLRIWQAWLFAVLAAGLYFGACFMISEIVLWLSPIPIVLMTFYPYTKRFTYLCHIILGVSLGLAPVGAWVAVISAHPIHPGIETTEYALMRLESPAFWLLGSAVALWVAGFDIIYALQDDEFDREYKLHSIPARFGRKTGLLISRALHVASVTLFFVSTWMILNPYGYGEWMSAPQTQLATWVWAAPCVMLAGMLYQHSLVKPNDLSRVNLAFFTVNGVISVVFGLIFLLAWLLY